MMVPTRRALLACTAAAPAAIVPALFGEDFWPLWTGVVGALVLLFGLDLALAPARARIALAVAAPEVLYAGATDPVLLTLQAHGCRRVRVQVLLETSGPLPTPPILELDAAGSAPAARQLPLQALRRGIVRLHRAHLRWTGPLGLLARQDVRALGLEARVLPDVRSVKVQALRFFARREFQIGLKVEQFVGEGSEFDAMREYVPGFDRRAVDWKASARHQKLLCREFRAERNHQVVLAVDSGHLMGEPLRGIPRVDHAINAALQLAYVGLRTGDLVGVHAFDERPRRWLRPESGLRALAAIQRTFADLEYAVTETNFTLGLTDLLGRLQRRSLVVLFTDFVDSITAELLVPNLERLSRRHLVLFVALRDPQLRELRDAVPEVMRDVHRAVVAAELVRERGLVLERVRRGGVQVLDADPDALAAGLVHRYLDLKRRERV